MNVAPQPEWNEAELEGALRLDPVGVDVFVNPRLSLNMNGKLFGGQFIANALSAAMLTAEHRVPGHFQGVFLRPGHAGVPLELRVERVHDGRQLSHRRVQMMQADRLIFSAQVVLREPAADMTLLHQAAPSQAYEAPESLIEVQELAERFRDRLTPAVLRRMVVKKAVLVKPVDPESALLHRSPEPRLAIWLKSSQALSSEPLMQYAALAFFSDFWLCWPCRSSHIDGLMHPVNRMSSLDHSMWFHASPRVDDWLLYEVESPVAARSFGLGRGALYTRDGQLLASCMQQALLS